MERQGEEIKKKKRGNGRKGEAKTARREKGKDKPKSPLVIVPEARESARSAAWLMVRRSPTYFTGHIYICNRSDLVIAHLSLICPLRVSSKDNDCIDQRRPQWVVLFRQG